MITLKKIAQEAGVSISAVSHFLNERRNNLSKETCERIGSIVDKYQYQPNQLVRGIQRQGTGCLGVIMPSCSSGYYPSTLDELERAARDAGFSLLLAQSHFDPKLQETVVNTFRGLRVDGLIIVPTHGNPGFFEKLLKIGTNIVFLDGYFDPMIAPAVFPNNEMSVAVALEHLWLQGHRRIGFIGAQPQIPYHGLNRRTIAYRNWMQSRGCENPDEWIVYTETSKGADGAMHLFLEKRCTAIVSFSDQPLHDALKGLRAAGVRVPEDLALVGMGNFSESTRCNPPLTSVDHQRDIIGAELIRLVRRKLAKDAPEVPMEEIQVSPKLVVRESSRRAVAVEPAPAKRQSAVPESSRKRQVRTTGRGR